MINFVRCNKNEAMTPLINLNIVYNKQSEQVVIVPLTMAMLTQADALSASQRAFLQSKAEKKELFHYSFFDGAQALLIGLVDETKSHNRVLELFRQLGSEMHKRCEDLGFEQVLVDAAPLDSQCLLAFAEGYLLAGYSFDKYKSAGRPVVKVKQMNIISNFARQEELEKLRMICTAVFGCRDLVNEPLSHLNAENLGDLFMEEGKQAGLKVEVFNKARIAALKMGGLLSVNRGSEDEPSFSVMEWKPENAVNKKPLVLIGKGIVFDTGGISLKPSANMEEMKGDMAGGALVFSVMKLLAKLNLPLHVVGLVPATDNRPGKNAMVPGDVITIYGGKTVEVINTDAEGRLIIADALSYASHYNPFLIIDFATLTGSAQMALGKYAMAGMQKEAGKWLDMIRHFGFATHERLVEFPLWDEMAKGLDSEVADMKNLGGKFGGMMTAGLFLAKFTEKPFIHFDIAPVAFSDSAEAYTPKGGTGFGVRLMIRFLEALVEEFAEIK